MRPIECAVIAAAGLGSRLGHGLPKCMIDIRGLPLLTHMIGMLEEFIPRIHVVVGYREELVIDLCSRKHRNVVIVRNPDFRSTNTARSMELGARGAGGKVLFIDGDLLLCPASLKSFVSLGFRHDILIGYTSRHSENAVSISVDMDQERNEPRVVAFGNDPGSEYEWANIFSADANFFEHAQNYVYQSLRGNLPAPAGKIESREIDTQSDLENALIFYDKNMLA